MFHSNKTPVFSVFIFCLLSSQVQAVGTLESSEALGEARTIYDLEFKKFQCVGMNPDGSINLSNTLLIDESGREEILDTQNDPVTGQPMRYLKTLRYNAKVSKNPLIVDTKEMLPLTLQFLDTEKLGATVNGVQILSIDVRADEVVMDSNNGQLIINKADVELIQHREENIAPSLLVFEKKDQLKEELQSKIRRSVGAWVLRDAELQAKLNPEKQNSGALKNLDLTKLESSMKLNGSMTSLSSTPLVPVTLEKNSIFNTPLSMPNSGSIVLPQGGGAMSMGFGAITELSKAVMPTIKDSAMTIGLETGNSIVNKGAITLNAGERVSLTGTGEPNIATHLDNAIKYGPKIDEYTKPIVDRLLKDLDKVPQSNAVLAVPYASGNLFLNNNGDKMRQHIYLCHIETDLELEE